MEKRSKFVYRPIDYFKSLINETEQIIDDEKIISQGNIFLQCFKEIIFKEYEINNYISFKFIINELIELNSEYDTFTRIPIIISPNITTYNYIHSMLKSPLKRVSNNDYNKFLFDKVCILLGWFKIKNTNNEIIEFLQN